jgi:hypothetical protein
MTNKEYNCPICFDIIEIDNKLVNNVYATLCGHLYHTNCINLWFEINNTCPTCRYAQFEKNEKINNEINDDDYFEEFFAEVDNYKSDQEDLSDLSDLSNDEEETSDLSDDDDEDLSNIKNQPKPNMSWVNKMHNHPISSVALDINNTNIDKQYGDWLNVWAQLTK